MKLACGTCGVPDGNGVVLVTWQGRWVCPGCLRATLNGEVEEERRGPRHPSTPGRPRPPRRS